VRLFSLFLEPSSLVITRSALSNFFIKLFTFIASSPDARDMSLFGLDPGERGYFFSLAMFVYFFPPPKRLRLFFITSLRSCLSAFLFCERVKFLSLPPMVRAAPLPSVSSYFLLCLSSQRDFSSPLHSLPLSSLSQGMGSRLELVDSFGFPIFYSLGFFPKYVVIKPPFLPSSPKSTVSPS